ncbi:MAG: exonuclease domain-containing protein, partial [Clostridiales bacterium]|nr:exonuclease domain-containing protein [Clostridiales bacterium]
MYSSPWVFIDLETTGLKPESDQIIEFGLVRREGPDQRTDWQQLINPGRTLDSFIVSITGIDDAMLTDSPTISSVREEAKAFLDEAVIVAHNAAFDVQFLEQQLQIQIDPRRIVDTIELAKILYPGLRSYSLRNLINSFHIPVLPNHRAGDDARALEQLFVCLAAKAERLSPSLLRQIAEILGEQEKGTGVFFTELLMDRRPAWLTSAIRDLSAVLHEAAHAPLPALEGENDLFPQTSSHDEAEEDTLIRSSSAEREERKDKEIAQNFWQTGEMRKFLEPDGALARKIDHFQHRIQQTEMLDAVSRAFENARYLMIEAPTGVGKSLAYLIPAICWAKATDQRVVVATHTIALQEQLFQKEVALLKETLPFSFQSVMLKGRGNYLCLHRWQQVRERGNLLIWGERILLAKLVVWQAEGGRGDMDSLHLFGMEREWFMQMTSSRETCQGNQCPLYKQCYFQKARAGANTAQLIIVNHALLLSGARLGEGVLPKHSFLVIDEAHHLEEDSIKQFTDIFSLMEFEKRLQLLHRRRDVFGRPGFLQYLKEYRQQGYAPLEKNETPPQGRGGRKRKGREREGVEGG